MKLSLIIPTFNRCQSLERLLTSLVALPEAPEEIIVVDDSSTDDTSTIVRRLAQSDPRVHYLRNMGSYQRDAKKNGLAVARGEYIGFLDDDVIIKDGDFFRTVRLHLRPDHVLQAKVILENLGKHPLAHTPWRNQFSVRPYPILELFPPDFNAGSHSRPIYPLIEFGVFFPSRLKNYFVDNNLIYDGYGESYVTGLKLFRAHIPMLFTPELVVYHPGSTSGGSNRFAKTTMKKAFTQFHAGYFYNMLYAHARFYPFWVWLWLPYFIAKALVALLLNAHVKQFWKFVIEPSGLSLYRHLLLRQYV